MSGKKLNYSHKLRFLHLHSSFNPGGKEMRAVALINAFGPGIEHTIVSAEPEALQAAHHISTNVKTRYPRDLPPLVGTPTPGRLQKLARAMKGFDLVLTYNWGAMDAVMAHTLFAAYMHLPPLVHHEDGFNLDEATKLKRGRNWYRQIALGRSAALVVPSTRLEQIAIQTWGQPRGRVHRIVNGIRTQAYGKKARPDLLPRLIKRDGEFWLGTLAGLRPVKNLPRLVRAFEMLPDNWHLVILGEGPEREAIQAEALRLQIAHRVHLPGFADEPAKAIGLFDLFALSSDSEQFPISVLEAMAGGLAVVAPAVGDVAAMLAPANAPFVTPPGDERALGKALLKLAESPDLRAELGAANRAKARAEYDESRMVAAYRAVYAKAMRRPTIP